jgi:hypothetical protein
METVKISLEEYKRLIKDQTYYYMLLDAVIDATRVKLYSWGSKDLVIDSEKIANALKMLDPDGFDAIYQRKLAEAEAERAEEEEREAREKAKLEEMEGEDES